MWVSSAVQLVELVQQNICQWSSVHVRREMKKKKILLDGGNESLSCRCHRHVGWMARSQWSAGALARMYSGVWESGEMRPCDWRSEAISGTILLRSVIVSMTADIKVKAKSLFFSFFIQLSEPTFTRSLTHSQATHISHSPHTPTGNNYTHTLTHAKHQFFTNSHVRSLLDSLLWCSGIQQNQFDHYCLHRQPQHRPAPGRLGLPTLGPRPPHGSILRQPRPALHLHHDTPSCLKPHKNSYLLIDNPRHPCRTQEPPSAQE